MCWRITLLRRCRQISESCYHGPLSNSLTAHAGAEQLRGTVPRGGQINLPVTECDTHAKPATFIVHRVSTKLAADKIG
jgi:hypothetical protein